MEADVIVNFFTKCIVVLRLISKYFFMGSGKIGG